MSAYKEPERVSLPPLAPEPQQRPPETAPAPAPAAPPPQREWRDTGVSEREMQGGQANAPSELGYAPIWGTYEPSKSDAGLFRRVAKVARKVGITADQFEALQIAFLSGAEQVRTEAAKTRAGAAAERVDAYLPPPETIEDDHTFFLYKYAASVAAAHGIKPSAFKELAKVVLWDTGGLTWEEIAKRQKIVAEDLVARFGYKGALQMVRDAARAIEHFGDEHTQSMFDSMFCGGRLADYPPMIFFLSSVGRAVALDAPPKEFNSLNPGGHTMNWDYTPQEQQAAIDEIKRLRKEHPFGTKAYDSDVEQRLQQLYQIAYPAEQEEDE